MKSVLTDSPFFEYSVFAADLEPAAYNEFFANMTGLQIYFISWRKTPALYRKCIVSKRFLRLQEIRILEEKIRIQEKLIVEFKTITTEFLKQAEHKNDIEKMRRLEEFFNNDMELDRKRYGIQ